MFCDQCGREMASDARYCSNCGRMLSAMTAQAPAPPNAGTYYYVPAATGAAGRIKSHVKTLGILWIVTGALRLLELGWFWIVGRMLIPSVLSYVPGIDNGFPLARVLEGGVFVVSGIFVFQVVLAFLAGWGLLEYQGWGRIVGIIAGVLSLLRFPLGTALGIYTLWVLLPEASEVEYRKLAREEGAV